MRLSLEGFGGEFEIGKRAFELEDLKKEKNRRGRMGGDCLREGRRKKHRKPVRKI